MGEIIDNSVDDGSRSGYLRENIDQVEHGVASVKCECQNGEENGDSVEDFGTLTPRRAAAPIR